MFLLNLGYQWGILDELDVDGGIFRSSGQDREAALRRLQPGNILEKLFDPQLYFLDYPIDPEGYPSLLAKLATYPWFGMTPVTYDSSEGPRRDWLQELRAEIEPIWRARRDPSDMWTEIVEECVRFQVDFNCTTKILPARLVADPEDTLDSFFRELDGALAVATDVSDGPFVAGVPLDYGTLAYREPRENELVEALADGLTARPGLSGAYVTLSTEAGPTVPIASRRVAGSVARLCTLMGELEDFRIILNFVECLGLACLGLGASAYGAAYSRKGRCLHIADYSDQGGGPAYPRFHSARLSLDFYSSDDLEKIRDARLLRYLEADRTDSSGPLLDALSAGYDVDEITVPTWAQRRNNVTQARIHFAQLHSRLGRQTWDADTVFSRLQDAEATWSYLSSRFEEDPLSGPDGRHLRPWRRGVEELLP